MSLADLCFPGGKLLDPVPQPCYFPCAEPPPPPSFEVVTTQDVVASATVMCRELVGGHVRAHESVAGFLPIPALWDERGIRMGLEDERHPVLSKDWVASANVKLNWVA